MSKREQSKETQGPLQPLPVIDEPFRRVVVIVHVSIKVLLGLGSDVGIIIEGSIFLIFFDRYC